MIQSGNYEKYADIINLPHHQSAIRPHMPVEDRAAQFSPFAALTGYEDAVKETARLTDERIELDEYSKEVLNQQLNKIKERLQGMGRLSESLREVATQQLSITYFMPDERKSGGTYVTITGTVSKLKEHEQLLLMADGTEIPIEEITEIVEMEKR